MADGRIACVFTREAADRLELLDVAGGTLTDIDLPYTAIQGASLQSNGSKLYFPGTTPTEPAALVELDVASGDRTVLRRSSELTVDDGYLSVTEAISFGGAHGFYYAPKTPAFAVPQDARPPLILYVHGGPTAHVPPILQLAVQSFTTRGIAV